MKAADEAEAAVAAAEVEHKDALKGSDKCAKAGCAAAKEREQLEAKQAKVLEELTALEHDALEVGEPAAFWEVGRFS